MSFFSRMRNTPPMGSPVAPPMGSPVAPPMGVPVAPPMGRPVAPPIPVPANTPNLSDAITQLKGGNRQSAEDMMRQIVGLPPLNAPGLQPITTDPAVLPPPNINRPITNMPETYPQGNPAQSQINQWVMQKYLDKQNLLAQQMNQKRNPFAGPNPYMQQMGPQPMVNPQSNDALKQQFLAQQGIYQPMPAYQSPAQETQQKMMLEQMSKQASMQQQMGPQQPGLTPVPFFQPGMQPQQPNSLGQQFGSFGMAQQPMGQFQQNNAQQMSNFQNQNQTQPAQNTQQQSGLIGRFGGFGGNGGGGGGGGGGLF